MEINFIACAEMIRAVLPGMRARKSGHILNVSSIGGRVNVGGFALYGAAKFALEGYSEALHDELKPLGIRVSIIEPGAFRTEFAGQANVRPETDIPDYQPVIEPIRSYLDGVNGKQLGDPRKAAQVMIKVVESSEPPLRILLGADAYGLWEQKRAYMDEETAKWRKIGEDTACSDAAFTAIGG
jgi:short-subunit dehydrogenase